MNLIIVIVIMVTMIGFMFLIIHRLCQLTGRQIQNDAMRLIARYDELLEAKSQELQKLKKEIKKATMLKQKQEVRTKLKNEDEFSNTSLKLKSNNFRDLNFMENYRAVQLGFDMTLKQILDYFYEEFEFDPTSNVAGKIMQKLSFDTFYELNGLSQEKQLEIIKEVLDEEEKRLLERFLKVENGFNALRFYEYLKMEAKLNNSDVEIRISETKSAQLMALEDVDFEIDAQLCEGVQIIANRKLYDFGISKREIV